jgi:hypothetical protein
MLSLIDVIGFVHTIYYQNVSLVSNSVLPQGRIRRLSIRVSVGGRFMKAHILILSILYRGRAVAVDAYH